MMPKPLKRWWIPISTSFLETSKENRFEVWSCMLEKYVCEVKCQSLSTRVREGGDACMLSPTFSSCTSSWLLKASPGNSVETQNPLLCSDLVSFFVLYQRSVILTSLDGTSPLKTPAKATIPSKNLNYHVWRNQENPWQNQIHIISFHKHSTTKDNRWKSPTQGGKLHPRKSKKITFFQKPKRF